MRANIICDESCIQVTASCLSSAEESRLFHPLFIPLAVSNSKVPSGDAQVWRYVKHRRPQCDSSSLIQAQGVREGAQLDAATVVGIILVMIVIISPGGRNSLFHTQIAGRRFGSVTDFSLVKKAPSPPSPTLSTIVLTRGVRMVVVGLRSTRQQVPLVRLVTINYGVR